jgi:hypothetical protein
LKIRHSQRLIVGLATLGGACLIFLLYTSITAGHTGRMAALVSAPFVAAILVWCLVVVIRKPIIGGVDQTGIFLKSWGIGLIPWADIAFFSTGVDGEGARIIGIHLFNENAYLSRMRPFTALLSKLRKLLGFAPLVIFTSNIDVPLATLIQKLKQYVPERHLPTA